VGNSVIIAAIVVGVLAVLGAVVFVILRRRAAGARQPEEAALHQPPAPAPGPGGEAAAVADSLRRAQAGAGIVVRQQAGEAVELGTPAAAPPRQIPGPPANFTGRAAELASLLARADAGATVLCIFGESGTGRTALALALCAALAERGPDAQLRLDLGGAAGREPCSAAAALARLIRALHPDAKLPAGEAALAAAWQSALAGKRALILLEDAAETGQVKALVPPAGSLLVATARERLALPKSFSRELAAPEPEEARALLLAFAPSAGKYADQIAGECARLPFAIRVAGLAQAAPLETDPADCAEILAEAAAELGRGAPAALRLASELAGEERARFWATLGVFPASFDRAAAAAVCRVPQDAAGGLLAELAQRGLIEREGPAGAERWRLHQLARAAAEERLGQAGRAEAGLRHAVYYMTVLRKAEKLCAAGGNSLAEGLALYDPEAENVSVAQAWAESQTGADETIAHLCNDFPATGARCLELRQTPRERVRWLEAALRAARQLRLRAAEAAHLARLAPACAELGEHNRAVIYGEQYLVLVRAAGDRGGEANALGLLATSSAALGEHRRAAGFYEEYLGAVRALADRKAEIAALGNLGTELLLLDERARAAECFEKQLAVARAAGDRRAEGVALGNLSAAGSLLGDHGKAAGFHEELLAFARAAGDRKLEAVALGRLASACHGLGDLRRVVECCEAQLAVAREAGDRRTELLALGNLAAACVGLGEHRRAAEVHEKYLAAARAAGDRKAETAALAGLGSAWTALGEPRRAIAFYEQFLAAARAAGGLRGAGAHLGNLGTAYYSTGDHRRAAATYEQQLAVAREAGDRKGQANALFNMSLALDCLGERAKAVERAGEALKLFEALADPNAARAREQLEKWAKKA